jgi:hypothetical protein
MKSEIPATFPIVNLLRFRRSLAAGHWRAFPKLRPYPSVAFLIVGFSSERPSDGTQRRAVRIPRLFAWPHPTRPTDKNITTADRGQRSKAASALDASRSEHSRQALAGV